MTRETSNILANDNMDPLVEEEEVSTIIDVTKLNFLEVSASGYAFLKTHDSF